MGLLWACCVICCEIAVVLPGVAVMLLWDCRGFVVQILREYCGTAVGLVWDNPGVDVGLRRIGLVLEVV